MNHYRQLIANFFGKPIFHIEVRVVLIVAVSSLKGSIVAFNIIVHFVVSDNNSTFVWMAVASAPHDRSTDSNIQAILACCSVWIYIRPLEFSQCMLLRLFLQF